MDSIINLSIEQRRSWSDLKSQQSADAKKRLEDVLNINLERPYKGFEQMLEQDLTGEAHGLPGDEVAEANLCS